MFVCGECGAAQDVPGACRVDGHPVSAIGDDPLLGITVGAYRIAKLLGVGGMGRVYKGVHPHIGSRVAIKVLSRECSDRPQLVDRFFAEARAVNLVNHEGIVNVLDLAVLPDRRPYIVMEYLDGAPLSAVLDAARAAGAPSTPLGGVARLAVEVLDALAAAHAKGIVHRDLKPDNIFVTPAGRSKILDFGIAKLQPEYSGMAATHTGSLLGTPQYMSPEQAAGRTADARADLYALGCILFECATLQRPFYAASVFDLLRSHIEEPVRPPRSLRPDMPYELEQVIVVALAKDPGQRFASALAMSQALQSATASLPGDQWTPLLPSGAAPPPRAHPSWGARPTPMGPPTPMSLAHGPTVASLGDAARSAPPNVSPQLHPPPPALRAPTPPVAGGGSWRLTAIVIALIVVGGGVTAVALTRNRGETDRPTAAPAPAPNVREEDPEDQVVEQGVANILNATTDRIRSAPLESAPAPAPAGWLAKHALALPGGYDPTNLDVAAFIPYALAEARAEVHDAELVRIDLERVDAKGRAHLTGFTDTVTLRFASAARSRANAADATFRIEASPQGVEIRSDHRPYEPTITPPRCPIPTVWQELRFPAGTEVASFSYDGAGTTFPPAWRALDPETSVTLKDCK